MEDSSTLHCSFCGKSKDEVKSLIAGPSAFICNECIMLCTEIVTDQKGAAEGTGRLSADEIADAARRQREAEEAQQYPNRTTTDLLKHLQEMRFIIDSTKHELVDIVKLLRERGVGAATIQQALGISPTDAIEQFLGHSLPVAGEADETADQTERLPEPVKGLIQRGKARGSVTYDELNAALPQEVFSTEELEGVLATLSELGINVVENADDA